MVRKFQSILKDRIAWRSLFRVLVAILLLLWARGSDFGFWPTAFFFAAALLNYLALPPERKSGRISFWVLHLTAYFALVSVTLPFFQILVFVIFGGLLFVVMGLARHFFQNRFLFYGILNTGLMLFLMMPVFYLIRPESVFGWLVFVFLLMSFVFGECFGFFGISGRRRMIFSLVLGLLGTEFTILIMFLPLGFINAAAFLVLILLLIRDATLLYFRGLLDLPFLLRESVFFVFLTVLIFATARWSIY